MTLGIGSHQVCIQARPLHTASCQVFHLCNAWVYMYLTQFLDYSLSSWWWNNHSCMHTRVHKHPAHSTLAFSDSAAFLPLAFEKANHGAQIFALEPAPCPCWSKSWAGWLSNEIQCPTEFDCLQYSKMVRKGLGDGITSEGRHTLHNLITWVHCQKLSCINWHCHTVHTFMTVSKLIPLDRASICLEPSTDQEWVDSSCVDKIFILCYPLNLHFNMHAPPTHIMWGASNDRGGRT